MLGWREIGDGQTHGGATRVIRHRGIRPGRNRGCGVDQRSDSPTVNSSTNRNELVCEWKRERCHVRLHVGQLNTEMADIGRCRKKLADDIRTGLRPVARYAHHTLPLALLSTPQVSLQPPLYSDGGPQCALEVT